MIPVLFGSRARPLVGVFLPASGPSAGRLAVLCPPFGIELLRTERALRVLSDRLAAAGVDVLRFDWYGTGDSGGEHRDLTLGGTTSDLEAAVDEGVHLAGGGDREVILVGHRHGAIAAALASGEDTRIRRLVLWDPVAPSDAARSWSEAPATHDGSGTWVDGFAVSRNLVDECRTLEGTWSATANLPSLVILTSAPVPAALANRTDSEEWPGEVKSFDTPGPWQPTSELGVGAIPGPALAAIVEWCT